MIILTGRWVYKIINQLKQFNEFIGEVTFYGAFMIKETMEIVNELGKNIVYVCNAIMLQRVTWLKD